ncbi:MAG: ADP-glyceromanno-heptose 6-epimerase [Chitinophagales bacterium]|nr:ADP-glyceromanno-heptose 6-epimerase [Chitinophagales bacterium]MDW8393549.1 ADP-glyceromanno-heptose 6-epimerase [Chitinophagales bacterium]
MIVITGAAGFIGSGLLARLNAEGIYHILAVDDFSSPAKQGNYATKRFLNLQDREAFLRWLDLQYESVEFIFHLGARTDTTEQDPNVFNRLNLKYSVELWNRCVRYRIPLVYASTAATYGAGELGYDDDESLLPQLKPLNPYGKSKHAFDKWVLTQQERPPHWWGLKFFNVFGPNEYHKGRMASVVFHGFNEIRKRRRMTLFRSHRPDYADGMQMRDFVYVKDVVDVLWWLYRNQPASGIFNVGSGKARTFLDLATATFAAMGMEPGVDFVDIPEDIRPWYQYHTEARMDKLLALGYSKPFHSLEAGIADYVGEYLLKNRYW